MHKLTHAVSALLCVDSRVYMCRRAPQLSVQPGHTVFPCGKIDAAARAKPADGGIHGLPGHAASTLQRELLRETGLDLAAALHSGLVRGLTPYASLETPQSIPQHLRVDYIRVDLAAMPELRLAPAQALDGAWRKADDWLRRYADGELLMAPPTLEVLQRLAADGAPGLFPQSGLHLPPFETLAGVRQFYVPSHTLPPATTTNCFLLGDADGRRILVDPSPKSRKVLDELLAAAAPIGFDEVFLTHHHQDHRQYANEIALRYGVPIGLSAYTEGRLRQSKPTFFDGVTTRHYREGDRVCHWRGEPVRVIEMPGHDEGQLGLMPDSRAWCLVGDLIQGIGSVVISPPEGNMQRYFASLQRLIELQPRTIFPSHGDGMGTVFRLEQTLARRRTREAEVLRLSELGQSPDDMLQTLYPQLPSDLKTFARVQIDSHLEKLRAEGRVA